LRLDRPLVSGCGNIDPEHLNERIGQVKKLITEFGNQRLHDTYTAFALQLCDTVADDDQFNLHRGRVDIWAAAIVYAIAQLNFLFSSETPNHLTPDELCSWFGVKKSTVSAKAGAIRSELDLFYDDERFCAPHITHMLQFFEDENGWVLPAAVCEKEGDARHAAPELKSPIGVAATAPGKSTQSEKPDKKEDDRQLPLFPES
jgi:hypothetical protein